MKARVKATGEIIEVELNYIGDTSVFMDKDGVIYKGLYDLDFDVEENHKGSQIVPLPYEPDYWDKLHHQAVIAAMQGILNNSDLYNNLVRGVTSPDIPKVVAARAYQHATAIVKTLK